MFENLTQREKILASAFGCMVPIVLLGLGIWSAYTSYQGRNTRIAQLQQQINDERGKRASAMSSGLRRAKAYSPMSLSKNKHALTEYQDWLQRLIRKCGLSYQNIGKPRKSKLIYRDQELRAGVSVADTAEYSFDASGSLEQIIKFCYEFERLELLHKIKYLEFAPIIQRNVRTGKFTADFKVEVLTMADADEQRDFLAQVRDLDTSFDAYRQTIVARNIFGPSNEPPRMALSRKSYYPGDEISFKFSASDPDKNDQLTFELLEANGLTDAKIETSGEGSSRATFSCAAIDELGEYEFKVRVSDNGFPSKSIEKIGKILIKARPVKTERKKVDPPKFVHATQTQIKRISLNRDRQQEVRITVKTLGESYELNAGDSFELDDKTWTVTKFDSDLHSVTLEVDGKLMVFPTGAHLNEPIDESELTEADAITSTH